MTRIKQLERLVEVLSEALKPWAEAFPGSGAGKGFAEADRIAAEPVEKTDAEVVIGWALADAAETRTATLRSRGLVQLAVTGEDSHGLRQCYPRSFRDLSAAAAWVRAQGGGRG